MLQIWYLSIDLLLALFRVKFEDGLSISILKNKATRHKTFPLEIEKFPKKAGNLKGRPPALLHTPPLSNFRVRGNRSRPQAPLHVKVFKVNGTYAKE